MFLAGVRVQAQDEQPLRKELHEDHHGHSPPLRDLPPSPPGAGIQEEIPLRRPHAPKSKPFNPDPVLQTTAPASVGPAISLGFLGLGVGFPSFNVQAAPPDANIAVGATQIVEWVNESLAVFDKSGNLLLGPIAGNAPWAGFGGPCETNNDGDPVIQYDKAANRWVATQLSESTGAPLQCVAVSKTTDATGAWFQYAFPMPLAPDYTKLGVWPDAYYLSTNLFTGNSFAGPLICALDRANMLLGQPARTAPCFQLSASFDSLLPADLDGATPPPSGSPNYLVSLGNNALNLWEFHVVDWTTIPATATLAGPTSLAVAPFTEACNGGVCVPQQGTGQKLDSLGYALMYRLAYRNFPADPNGAHESLVANHSVGSPSGVRWYELRQTSSADFNVYQQGTFAPADGNYRWMGSIAMDKFGDLAVGYSVSGAQRNPSIAMTGCVPNASASPPCTMAPETVIINGTGSQTSGLNRWGDYTSMSVDPVDDCTFWYVNEFLKTSGKFNWSTQLAAFRFPSCPSPPPTATATRTTTRTVTRTPTATRVVTPMPTLTPTPTPTRKGKPKP